MSEWIDASREPPLMGGTDEKDFIVCVVRVGSCRQYVFAATYLDHYAVYSEDGDADDDGMAYITGWYHLMDDPEYETAWHPVLNEGDRLTHFTPLPEPPCAT